MTAPVHFRDLVIGQRWRSDARTLSQTELDLFTMLTGDRHPLHADAHFAAQSHFGSRIFQGTYGIALAVALSTELPRLHEPIVAATGISEWKFHLPLVPGDTVHAVAELLEVRRTRSTGRGLLLRRLTLVKQDGSELQSGTSGLLVELHRGGDSDEANAD